MTAAPVVGACPICQAREPDGQAVTCAPCRVRLVDQLADLPRLAELAAAQLVPSRHGGSGGRGHPSSRPPIDVAAVDPALALIRLEAGDPSSTVTVLDCLEMHERAVRDQWRLAPLGPATAARARAWTTTGPGRWDGTLPALRAAAAFLAAWNDRICEHPDWPHHAYAGHLRRARRALARWDPDHAPAGIAIPCPALTPTGGECGTRLRLPHTPVDQDGHAPPARVACPRCGATWTADRLVRVATSSSTEAWIPADLAAWRSRVHVSTLYRRGLVHRGLVRLSDTPDRSGA